MSLFVVAADGEPKNFAAVCLGNCTSGMVRWPGLTEPGFARNMSRVGMKNLRGNFVPLDDGCHVTGD